MSSNFKNIKVAVIGAGAWGKNLIRNFNELGAMKIVCDTDTNVQRELKNQYPDITFTTSYKEVLDNRDIEGIVIATPAE
ncbi:Gfo/Idh/MocA family oxidoreductase, partial [candidate division WOR-3 bacterium]|nr:Gfo/Idh/MocA family oxidoreductase [candidate division WOR-3 bacterium]